MGVLIPQVVTESSASGAQVIDGSLKFDGSKSTALKRTPSSDGNRRTWTWSAWVKKHKDSRSTLFSAGATSSDTGYAALEIESDEQLRYMGWNTLWKESTEVFRDYNQFYHIVLAFDSTQATASNRVRLYKNGTEITDLATNNSISQNTDYAVNDNVIHYIGGFDGGGGENLTFNDYTMSQVYLIDGQALGPESFGYTDGLTNTWRPKKFSGSFTQSSANDGTTWSSSVSGPVNSSKPLSLLFGGTIGSGYANGTTPTVGNTLTLDISSLNLNVTNVRLNSFISRGPGGGGAPSTYTVNGTTVSIDNSDGDQTNVVAVNGQLNTIAWSYDNGNGPYVYMRGIEVDLGGGLGYELLTDGLNNTGVNSFYLPMDGNSPIGKDLSNPNPINNGTVWSALGTGAADSPYRWEDTFDGNSSTYGAIAPQSSALNLDLSGLPGGGLRYESSVVIVVNRNSSAPDLLVNGVAQSITANGSDTVHTISGSGLLTSVGGQTRTAAGSGDMGIKSISIDGVELIDGMYGNSWTAVNFGGSVSLDNPIVSGALPILNTVSGGNYATVGVRTDDLSSNLKLAVDHAGTATDRTNAINGNTNLMTSFSANNSTYAYPTDASGSPYGKALYISGTGDYPRINYTAGDFNFMHNQDDSGTVEFWFYNGAYSTEGYLFANVGESSQVGLNLPMGSATTFNCYIQRGVGGGSQNAGTSTLPQNKWSHIAVTKQKVGSNVELKVYVNGVNTASNTSITATDLSNSNSAQTYWQTGSPIGHESSRGFTNAYISDIRIYNTVKYTSDFVVPSTSPDILPDTPSGVSGSSKLAKVTDGAVSFDGSGDYLALDNGASLRL